MIEALDLLTRRAISILYRFLLLANGLIIWLSFENIFPSVIYLGASIGFVIIYIFTFNKKGILSIIRLINDYAFIFLILWGKPIDNFLTFSLVLLPIANSVNHSTSEKKSKFSFLLICLTVFILYAINNFSFKFSFIVPVVSFTIINFFVYYRTSMVKHVTKLHDTIERFYEESFSLYGTNKILKNITNLIKHDQTILRWFLKPNLIIAFRIVGNKLLLQSSSNFIISYKFDNEEEFIRNVRSKSSCEDFDITIDGRKFESTLGIYIRLAKENNYVFIIICYSKLLGSLYLEKILRPLFAKISRVFEIENELKLERNKYLGNIKSKMQFVASTIQAVHFLNNKFTPITDYFSLTKRIDKVKDDYLVHELRNIIDQERIKASENLNLILAKFNEIRARSLNPYLVQSTLPFTLFKIFSVIRRIWEENNLDRNFFEVEWTNEILNMIVEINLDSFEYVLEEIVLNIRKHSTNDYALKFTFDKQPITIFSNKIQSLKKNDAILKRLVRDFNNEKTSETIKRTSYGLSFIKQFLEQLNIEHNISIENGNFILTLKYNAFSNENSDN